MLVPHPCGPQKPCRKSLGGCTRLGAEHARQFLPVQISAAGAVAKGTGRYTARQGSRKSGKIVAWNGSIGRNAHRSRTPRTRTARSGIPNAPLITYLAASK
jgi:hypothetical protein